MHETNALRRKRKSSEVCFVKKCLCLLLAASLLLGMMTNALAAAAEAETPAALLERIGQLWDQALYSLGIKKETAVEKQLREWQEQGAYIAMTTVYVLDSNAVSNIQDLGPSTALTADYLEAFSTEETLRRIQSQIPALSALSMDELGERIFVCNPTETRILDVYTVSYQDGEEALELARVAADIFCDYVRERMEGVSPHILSLPTLME